MALRIVSVWIVVAFVTSVMLMFYHEYNPTLFGAARSLPATTISPLVQSDPAVVPAAQWSVVTVVGELPHKKITGTGFFISPAGLVVTSAHVVRNDNAIYHVETLDGKMFAAEKILLSDTSDIALIRTQGKRTPWLDLDVRDNILPGQNVALLGAGEKRNVSFGEVAQSGRNVLTNMRTLEEQVIQINAEVVPGDSGGPVLNADGHVIGIVFAFDPENAQTGFAIPATRLRQLVEQLLQEDYGIMR